MRIRSVFSHSFQAVVEGALISLLVVGLMAGTAFAAKPLAGTNGHKGGGTTSSSATLAVDPSVVGVGASYTVTGCGYQTGAPLNIKFISSTANLILFAGGDASGCFTFSNKTWDASVIRVEAWQYTGKWALMATTSFTVQ